MMSIRFIRAIPFLLLLWSLTAVAESNPLLYEITRGNNTVWLLGSVHALRTSDYPLDSRIETAYTLAERIVLEVDPTELEPQHIGRIALELGRLENDRGLADIFSQHEHDELREGFATLGLDLRQFESYEPWFAALQLLSLNLARHGFATGSGVDRHFAERAVSDKKETAGLETAREQLQLFDSLPMETQKTFLQEALEDSDDFGKQMTDIVSAWRRGDIETLEKLADEELGKDPELREALLSSRNRRWAKEIAGYLDDSRPTLVIVGALHLVGDDGVVELLREKGYEVERVAREK